ncbi:zinc finger C2H2 type [Schistosoma japonicum]|uniref:Zinc finger C2H2 type n=1 Tax=Schistosoma japonicum TaxID=6182 RepID=A0A4Z2CMF1_SCHJA|nr:zinc finger C2H2 type [Schistosoma japonicum]KAH8861813.1 zinc finger C2H2 type [Schistosoma japonicum]TNN05402.1 zinc finger C2H2 type [Schistosoma japonicum]
MSSVNRNRVGNKKLFYAGKNSNSNVSVICRSPGGILFSSVLSGLTNVHSADKYPRHAFSVNCTQNECEKNIKPVSLFNSLLDPNIELPAISVREVDEILSNLTSPSLSPSKPTNGNSGNTDTHIDYCDIPENLCQDSSEYTKSASITKLDSLNRSRCSLQATKASSCKQTEVIEHNVTNDPCLCISNPELDGLPASSNVCCTLILNSIGSSGAAIPFGNSNTLNSHSSQNSRYISSCRQKSIDVKEQKDHITHKKRDLSTVSPQSMADILPFFPSCRSVAELGALAFGVESNGASAHKHKLPSVTLRSKACSGIKVSNIPTKVPVFNSLRDRSPIGSLDLATHNKYQNPFNVSTVKEASKYRQAYLSVRKANQAKVLSKCAVSASEVSVSDAQSQENTSNQHICCQSSNSSQSVMDMKITSTNVSECSTRMVSDDRFKYICPHPRCGRRYQAEIGLLRHLVKYHGEQIELPQRTRRVANRHMFRRPASEERTVTSIGIDEDDKMDKNSSKPNIRQNKTVSLSHSKSLLEANQVEIAKIDFNPTTLPFEGINISGYSKTEACDKLKEITPVLDDGMVLVCSAASPSKDETTVSVPLINLNANMCCSNFPVSVDMDNTNPNDTMRSLTTEETKFPILKPIIRKKPRLRSVSGSHSDLPVVKHSTNNANHDITTECEHHFPTSLNLSATSCTTDVVNVRKDCNLENGRRRTLSTGHDPRLVSNTNVDNNENDNCSSVSSNKCPSCGHVVDQNSFKTKQREWISGVHALSCSKTDCVYCPVDNCTYICSGRADLSAHLTSIHFPEIQHQLVRLIFACPLKDCQIICSDEASFQAHFTEHLHGHLPGDLTELFNPSSLLTTPVGATLLSSTTMTKISTSTPIVQSLIDDSTETSSHSLSSNVSYGQETHCLTDYTSTVLSLSSACDNYHEALMNARPSVVVGGNTLSTTYDKAPNSDNMHSHSEMTLVTATMTPEASTDLVPVDPSSSLDNSTESRILNHHQHSSPIVSISPDLNTFSHYCHHQHHRQKQHEEQPFSVLLDSSLFSNDSSIDTLSEAIKSDSDSVNDVPNVVTNETGHVDLTDNRNLLSALDLIPDDILIGLLKEDRASLWIDPVANTTNSNSNNNNESSNAVNPTLSAPYECNTESICFAIDSSNNNNNDKYATMKTAMNGNEYKDDVSYNPCDASNSIHDDSIDEWVDFNLTGSMSPLSSFENLQKGESCTDLFSDDSSSWIPSNIVHHTWSSAIANEKQVSSRRHFTCPHRVISDLTAALILPDVERRLKASISSTRTTKSSLPLTSTVCSSISSQTSSQSTFSAMHQSCCSGKRRRNASESPPLSAYNAVSFSNVKSSLSDISSRKKSEFCQSLLLPHCWKRSINDVQVISSSSLKRPYNLKTLSVGNANNHNNKSHCLTTSKLDSEVLNSKINNNVCLSSSTEKQQQQQTCEQTNVISHYEKKCNHVVNINLSEEHEQGREEEQQQQQLMANCTATTTTTTTTCSNSSDDKDQSPLVSTKLLRMHESRKRLKKSQKSSTLTCQTYFTPYSIEKYIIPRPVLPRRHSMATYNHLMISDCFMHLPH